MNMKKIRIGVVGLIAVVVLIAFMGMGNADTGVPAVPETQGFTTSTSSNVLGTVTETDSVVWTLTNDPFVLYTWTDALGVDVSGAFSGILPGNIKIAFAQLEAAGGSAVYTIVGPHIYVTQINIPESLLDEPIAADPNPITWRQLMALGQLLDPVNFLGPAISQQGIHDGVLDPYQVQYTASYNDEYAGVSGQQSFTKSMTTSTGNTVAGQSNIDANTLIEFIASDTGRATRAEDLLIDGASQAQDASVLFICPFAGAEPGIVPAFCNIVEAGSTFDTTLTSTVTSVDTRFVGIDAAVPVELNYNINSQGITLGDQYSPMVGSVSAYLNVHVQEARNENTLAGSVLARIPGNGEGIIDYSFPSLGDPLQSEDLVYSETSTASGLITKFSKSMSYSSRASAVTPPEEVLIATVET